jgi:diaminohydroxyphosphoribosylaminopyrimidine deaminase/5-amino-6-(5-phosphoribosylamino)uracil reductase
MRKEALDQIFMQRALELAARGAGHVAPNPLVGCVVVHEGKIIGEGWHEYFGGPHAEVNAIQSVSDQNLLASSTLYVTLEPCAHHGKTPPCSTLIIEKGIPQVVVGTVDPFAAVAGKGLAMLEAAGCAVQLGVLESACRWLNRRFFCFHEQKRPYVILKWAQSKDGFIAPAKSGPYWISAASSKLLSHHWRSQESAILVGAGTVVADDPALTTRLVDGPNPKRIVLEAQPLSATYKVFDAQAPTLRYTMLPGDWSAQIPSLLAHLHAEQLNGVLVEGGAKTLQAFLKSGLWDEILVFIAPARLKEGLVAPALPEIPFQTVASGDDELRIYLNANHQWIG